MIRAALFAFILVASASSSISGQDKATRDRASTPYRLGFESMQSENWAEAAKLFQDAIDIDPTFEMAHYMLGRAELGRKEYARAIAALERARNLYRAQAGRQFTNKQEAQRIRRDLTTEIDDYIRQLQGAPQTRQTQEQIRQLNERKRQLSVQIDRGNNISLDLAVPAYVSLSLGSAYFRSGRLPEAEKAYREAVAADPKVGEAHSNLAVVYMETGRYAEAEKSIDAAEKAGFKVAPALKAEIAKRKSGT